MIDCVGLKQHTPTTASESVRCRHEWAQSYIVHHEADIYACMGAVAVVLLRMMKTSVVCVRAQLLCLGVEVEHRRSDHVDVDGLNQVVE